MDKLKKRRHRFETVVNTYAKDAFRYAYWLCKDRDTAEDIVQESFTRAWKSLDQLTDDGAAKSWLFTILRRENARRFERYKPQMEALEPNEIVSKGNYDTSIEAFVLRQALAQLNQEYREPLVLQVIGGYSMEEIAQQLGLSKGAVMTRVLRARQKLRVALGEEK
jgi:RNA polymerase sigma-70 factor (ECF subfamily)